MHKWERRILGVYGFGKGVYSKLFNLKRFGLNSYIYLTSFCRYQGQVEIVIATDYIFKFVYMIIVPHTRNITVTLGDGLFVSRQPGGLGDVKAKLNSSTQRSR